ncbi:MAG: 2-oxo-4-hydroxy-4-carboxy-5-ureidoimidazoline decarboxylase [Planctomycetaceae bacterium]|nr:2-oxo-4-hydroxy-4-carboxy-5-ureidoimidazoline decarboxylase [Planctomycetaceae bacterium]
MKTKLGELNTSETARFVEVCGPLFERSPWIAERTVARRPFDNRDALHSALCETVTQAAVDEQLTLIRAHPDLVGWAALAGTLTSESTREQAAAGLSGLAADDVRRFTEYNAAYWAKFDFPFVICARENKKDAILAAFPVRLANTREQEIRTALDEIAKIARLRLYDAVEEG